MRLTNTLKWQKASFVRVNVRELGNTQSKPAESFWLLALISLGLVGCYWLDFFFCGAQKLGYVRGPSDEPERKWHRPIGDGSDGKAGLCIVMLTHLDILLERP